jgi:TonB-dependent starch-binding outer membrane protein SusC
MKTIYNKLFLLLFLLPFTMLAQSTLDGTVVDQKTKQPIPGVNVLVQGSLGGTQTDFNGKFKLLNVKKGDKVVFSYIGYKNQVIPYNGQNSLTVSLEEDSNELKEVVVQTGYGSVKKKDATGSVALITSKEFNKGAIVSTDQLLAGKAAGVRITNNGGNPDSAPNIRIRGGASLNASNNPLIIIDGVPIGDLNPAGVSNPFSLINPNDVESFSILKDASATAIYGVRASNGVILITTKKGTTGAPQFNFSTSVSVGTVGKKIDVMNSQEFTRFIQENFPKKTYLLGIDDPSTSLIDSENEDDPSTSQVEGRILSSTDWQDQILRTAISSDNNFSARANLYKKIPFRASIGFNNTQGLIKTNDYKRLSYSVKLTPKLLNDNLKVDINAKGTYTDKNSVDEDGALGSAISMDPTKPVFGNSINNKFVGYYQATKISGNRDQFLGATNPLALLEQRSRPETALRFLGSIEFDYKIPFLKGLRAVANFGLDASQSKIRETFADNALASYVFTDGTNSSTNYLFNPGLSFQEKQTATNKTMDTYLAYSKEVNKFVSKFDFQTGYSYQDFKTDGNKEEFQNNKVTQIREPKINVKNPNNRYFSPLNLQAFFARSNVDFLGKYLFTATVRADGSSLFVPKKRWGVFPALGFAWKIKEEKFLKDSKLVQDLKFRLGWGKTGQSNIPEKYFPSQLLFEPGNVNSQYLPDVTTYSPKDFNADLTWEKTTTINFGLDFEFFKNSIFSGSLDVYKRKTTDLLAEVPFRPGGTVATVFFKNIGSLDSDGVELAMNVKPISNDNFNLSLGGNIAYNYNTITELEDRTETPDNGSGIGGTGVPLAYNHVGYQPYSALVYEQVYDSNGQPVVGAFVDRNSDGEINSKDQYFVALRPNWTFGTNTNINYKNWDLSASFRGQIGGQIYNRKKKENGAIQSAVPQNGNSLNNVLNFYSGVASLLFDTYNGKLETSDYLLENATFFRCDNISLAYKISKFVNKSSLKINGAVNNPFIVTKYSGQDPENFSGIDNKLYPRPVTYTLGLSIEF